MKIKPGIWRICTFLLIWGLIGKIPPACALELSSVAAVAMDATSGRVLYEKNAREKMGMASTTKIMTALVALEQCDLNEMVKVSVNAVNTEGSSMYLEKDETITVENLLYGLMLNSGNDAAVALAEHISGSTKEFAKLMTKRAKEIGAKDTQFKNPHGLYEEGHYTTAYDLALIYRTCMCNPTFAKIAATKKWVVPLEGKPDREYYNKNKLLSMFDGVDGGKPGYTPETGRTLVGSATRNGWRVITVTLNTPSSVDWQEHGAMFDYVFDHYELKTVVKDSQTLGTIPVKDGEYYEVPAVTTQAYQIPLPKNEPYTVKFDMKAVEELRAPVEADTQVGTLNIEINGKEEAQIPLVTKSFVNQKPTKNIFVLFWRWVSGIFIA